MNRFYSYLVVCLIAFSSCKKNAGDDLPLPPVITDPLYKLDYMEIEEHEYHGVLHLFGYFGDSTKGAQVKMGKHTYGNSAADHGRILTWKPYWITVKLSTYDDDGGGWVSVINNGSTSNQRLLNVWHGVMMFKSRDEGTLYKDVKFDVYLRADSRPHTSPIKFEPKSTFFDLTGCYYYIGGLGKSSSSDGGMTIWVDYAMNVLDLNEPNKDRTQEATNFQCEVQFKNRQFLLSRLRVHARDVTKIHMLADGAPEPYVTNYTVAADILPLNFKLPLQFEGNSDVIKEGKWTSDKRSTEYDFFWDAPEAPNHMHVDTLYWERMEPKFK